MTRLTSQPSPTVINAKRTYLPPSCEATADEIVQQIIEHFPDETRQVRKEAA